MTALRKEPVTLSHLYPIPQTRAEHYCAKWSDVFKSGAFSKDSAS